MSKKEDSKVISIYWFIILVVVAGGVFLMANLYYNAPYDVRQIEANVLSEKAANCIYSGNKFNKDFVSGQGVFKDEFRDNFLKKCSLYFNPPSQFDIVQYYIEVNLYEYPGVKNVAYKINAGNPNGKEDCASKEEEHEKFLVCSEKEFYGKSDTGKIYLIKILSVVRKAEQNVK